MLSTNVPSKFSDALGEHPAPKAHPAVMAAVTDKGEVDFEIIDDMSRASAPLPEA